MRPAAKTSLQLQSILGCMGVFILGPAYFLFLKIMGYRIRDLNRLRRSCTAEFRKHSGPWIICANHLTMVDSMILIYGLFSLYRHLVSFRMLPWNLPERDNFQSNPVLAFLCYFAKCIPVNRGGDREEMKRTLEKCDAVLTGGQNLLIFPEGGRSRTGRVDREGFSYGVGRFVNEVENCRILCIYLRGDHQQAYGTIPRFGERFSMTMDVFRPEKPKGSGLRAQRDYAAQIVGRLVKMEENYFAAHRERRCGFDGSGKKGDEQECTLHRPRLYTR